MRKPKRKKKSDIKTVVLYVRVSTTEQAEQGLSLDAQRGGLERYAKEHGYEVARVYVERGASGTDDNRPVFRQMTADVLVGDLVDRVDAILVLMTSRFMRDSLKARVWKQKLEAKGIRVVATQQDFGDDLNGKLAESIFEALDEYESAVNGERTRLALREAAKQGFFPTSRAPFGYRTEKIEIRPGVKKTKLVVEGSEAETLREVFAAYLGGLGAMQVARAMNDRGLRDRGGRPWRKDRVLQVVSDPVAIGNYVWCRDEDEPVVLKVEPVLDEETFARAMRLRDEREPKKNPGRTSSSPLLLARVAHCGACGAKLIKETSGKEVGGATPFQYYNCREHKRGLGKAACLGVRIGEAELDQAVLEHISAKVFTAERCRGMLVELLDSTDVLQKRASEQLRNVKRDLEDIERKIRTWEQHVETGEIPVAVASERLQELRGRRNGARATLAKVVPLRPLQSARLEDGTVERFTTMLRDSLLSGGPVARTYLRFLIERIEVTRASGDARHVKITARKGNAMQLLHAMASEDGNGKPPGATSVGKPPGGVRTCVASQLRDLDSNQGPIG
jgi:site-specific DNA recombinase